MFKRLHRKGYSPVWVNLSMVLYATEINGGTQLTLAYAAVSEGEEMLPMTITVVETPDLIFA